MKPEFEQLLKGLGILFYQDGTLETRYLDKLLFQELMENTWNLAIEAAAENGECDCDMVGYWDIGTTAKNNLEENVECALNRNSILKLKI